MGKLSNLLFSIALVPAIIFISSFYPLKTGAQGIISGSPSGLKPQSTNNEANQNQLNLAQNEGSDYEKAFQEMIINGGVEGGSEKVVGDYIVGFIIDKAGSYYAWDGNQLTWHPPGNANAHIEIMVRDSSGRFLPYLNVMVTLIDSKGNTIGTYKEDFIWHPWLFHYAQNWVLPNQQDTYTVKVSFTAPTFNRHDQTNGSRYKDAISTQFQNVKIVPGQK